MRCILCVIPYLLLDHSADLHETFGVYTVQPQLMQGTLFNFRSKPWNRKSQFSQDINFILWENILLKDIQVEVDTYLLRKRRVNWVYPENFIRIGWPLWKKVGHKMSKITHRIQRNWGFHGKVFFSMFPINIYVSNLKLVYQMYFWCFQTTFFVSNR